jgi:putative oxidoreductase
MPLLVIMAVALTRTKVPIFMNEGFWAVVHEARTDWAMTLGALCLLVVGAGAWSVDASLSARRPGAAHVV